MEGAAGGRVGGAGDFAGEDDAVVGFSGGGLGDGGEERDGVGGV